MKRDPLLRMKFIAYCWAEKSEEKVTFKDQVNFCKFQLCVANNLLMKDPIWDEYTDEEILVEFFAHKFHKDKEFREEFEREHMDSGVKAFSDWVDAEVAKDNKELENKMKDDAIHFSPLDLIGE